MRANDVEEIVPDERCYFGCADEEPFHKLLEIPAPYLRIPQLCRAHSKKWWQWKRDLDRDTKWPDDFWPFVDNTLAALAAENTMTSKTCSTCPSTTIVTMIDGFAFCDTCDANLALAADGREGADDESTYGAFVRQWVADRTGASPGPRGAEKVKRVRTTPRESTILAMSCTPYAWYVVPSGEIEQFLGLFENKAWFRGFGDVKNTNLRGLSTAEKVIHATEKERDAWIASCAADPTAMGQDALARAGVEATTPRESPEGDEECSFGHSGPVVLSFGTAKLCGPCAESWQTYALANADTPESVALKFKEWCDEHGVTPPSETSVHFSSASVEWATPQSFFDGLNARWNFTLDVCATPQNAKCPRFFTKDDDGLAQEWMGACWMNPEYGRRIGAWMAKARASAKTGKAAVVCLVPARTDTAWWWDNVNAPDGTIVASGANFETGLRWVQWSSGLVVEVTEVRGRLKFENPEREESWQAPFPSAVVSFYLAPLPR